VVQLYDNTPPENASITIRVFPAAATANLSATGSTTKVVRNPTSQFVTSTNEVDPALIPFGSTAPGPFSGLSLNPAAPSPNITVTQDGITTVSSGSFSQGAVSYTRFLSYEMFEDYLTPAAAGNFSLAADELSDSDRNALLPGSRVEVSINDQVQILGYIDDIRSFGNRSSGSVWTIEFRDWLSASVDAHVDPQTRVKPTDTFEQAVIKILSPFGVTVIAEDAIANRNAITGAIYGTPTSKKGKPSKKAIAHECKPYQAEGALAFASRITQRAGLWIRPAVDGKTAIVAAPDFDQPSRYAIRLKTDGTQRNNVTDWDVRKSRLDQPSLIFGAGFGGGGEWPKSTLRGAIINPLIALSNADIVAQLLSAYPGLVGATPPAPAIVSAIGSIMLDPNARPLYLYDSESKTADELRAYLRRELALRMRKSLVAQYTIEGHTLGGHPIAVDTMIDVEDDIAGINGPLWVLSRRFTKVSGEQGTKTQVHLIRPGTLLF
jgi:prophage tail gpP-like protein